MRRRPRTDGNGSINKRTDANEGPPLSGLRTQQDAQRAARFHRQLQPPAIAIRQSFEGADPGSDCRTSQRLRQTEHRITGLPRPDNDNAARLDAELEHRRRIETTFRIGNQQRLLFPTSVLRQQEGERPCTGARPTRQQFDQRSCRQSCGKQLAQSATHQQRCRFGGATGRLQSANSLGQNTNGF
jgi:hypothetical protein